MRKLYMAYFVLGGFMMMSTAIAYAYFILFTNETSELRMGVASLIGVTGLMFSVTGADQLKSYEKKVRDEKRYG